MSHQLHYLLQKSPRGKLACRAYRVAVAVTLGVAASLFAAPVALAGFSMQKLHVGAVSGSEDYLYTAGNTVVSQATVDTGRYYRFDVSDPSGTVHFTSACRPSPARGTVTASYPIQSSDPLSNTTAWRFRLREFATASNCASGSASQHDQSLYFDVAAATSYSSSALTTKKTFFKSASVAYLQVSGVGSVKGSPSNNAAAPGSWSTTWTLPSGAIACANTGGGDRPGSTAGGQLPDRTSLASPALPNLQYRPLLSAGVDPWNVEANYETRPCQDFASTNQGRWSLKVSRDNQHFVTLPAFTVDTTPPVTTITGGVSHVTSLDSATFSFTSSEANSTFQCSLDGASASACTSSQTYNGLSNGPHTFTVQAIDQAGNVDPTGTTNSWRVDTTVPPVTLSTPGSGSYTNNPTPVLSGTAEAGSGNVTVDVYPGNDTSGSPVQSVSTAVQGDGSWSVNAASLTEGTYTVQARQTDAASNTGYSPQHMLTVDTTAPAVTIATPANGTHTNDSTPFISGTAGTAASDLPTVTVTVTGGSSPVQATASVSPQGTWAIDLPQALADGNYSVHVAQQDLAGNTGSNAHALTIDTTPPQTFLDAAPVGTTSSTTAIFSFHLTDALSRVGSSFQCQLDGGAWGACSSPMYYYNLASGSHTLVVQAIDAAGNVDTGGQTTSWTVDTSVPTITLSSPAQGAFTSDTTPTLSGTAGTATGDASAVQVLIYSGTNLSGSPVQTLSTTAAGDGTWSVDAAPLGDGTYVAYAQQSGSAGTGTSPAHTFTVQTHAPTTTITLGPVGNSGTGTASFSFISSDAGSTFQCQLDAGGWTACLPPQSYSGLSNGSHTFQVRAIDQAGNVGAAASQTWSVNASLPALALKAPSDGVVTNNQAPAISGTGGTASGDDSVVTVKIYSGTDLSGSPLETITTTVSSTTGAWSTHPNPSLGDGTYTTYAQQVGAAGTAYTSARTFTVNTTPPTTSIVSGPQGLTSATSARFTFTASESGSTFECQLDAGAWTACTSPQSYSSLTSGTHTFSVRATDPAGNVDPNPPVATWSIAATVPVTLTSPADGTMTNNASPTFSGAASNANGPISVEIDDSSGDPVETLTAPQGTSWSAVAAPALPEGSYTAFAYQLDSNGIDYDYSAPISFTVDQTPPALTFVAPPKATNDTTPTFTGVAGGAAGDLSTVHVDIYSGTSPSGTPVQTLSATVAAGAWSASPTALADGTYTARAHQADTAGNTAYTAGRTFTVDTVAPTTTITSAAPASPTTTTSETFSFTSSEPGSTFECQLDSAAWTACSSPESYSSLGAAAHTFRVRATDAAGNVSAPATQNWTVVAPPPPNGTTPAGSSTPAGTPPPATDTAAAPKLQLALTAKRKQRLSRRSQPKVQARCAKACSLALTGTVKIVARAHRGARTKPRTLTIRRVLVRRLAGGKRIVLTIKLPAKTRNAIKSALSTRERVTLTLVGVATAPGMKSGAAQVTIQLVL